MSPVTFYKCLADETRLKTLLLLQQEGELCVCELMAALEESQPKVSRHLAQLRKSGLLNDRRQGQWVFYRIRNELPSWAKDVLALTIESNQIFLQDSMEKLCRMGDRPERVLSCC
ncbi:transcriptional regulator [Enterovibrio norvegicus FF-33]|uniref:metalloregulator ArsR/SmtB family transcription factor n=1 Tax=Enterovibrio norvegicus TaxID=188144 RepID=UPI0002FD38C7|nr:metalloregulator ArsR/SmtB family transcription factor [Enterovibrio norvegicus]OEE67343.1 transcriptional regulator [Enterovibrio norvegicus FF-33]OEE86530.1 transcriptional regulator [Enterovibrio norvegicus FF-162]